MDQTRPQDPTLRRGALEVGRSLGDPAADRIRQLLREHETYRSSTLNLIASENSPSTTVLASLANDLVGRYADYQGRNHTARRYRGNRYILALEREVARLACEVFRAEYVELRPLAGHLAGVAVLLGLCQSGDLILELGRDGGGHREAARLATVRGVNLKVEYLPFDGERFNVDVAAAIEMIEAKEPRLVILGSSSFLFPHPVRDLAAAVQYLPRTLLAYDASHVLGFLAAGVFQDPIGDGADLVFGSTHKTLPGPQGGIVYTDREDLIDAVSAALVPGLVTNHHPFRIPALGFALAESRMWGAEYCTQITDNSNVLGAALEAAGIRVVKVGSRYTESHTLLIGVSEFGDGDEVALLLEEAGINTTNTLLPEAWGGQGIRLGTQEVTRRGAQRPEMELIASLIAESIRKERPPDRIRAHVFQLAASLTDNQYTWPTLGGAPEQQYLTP